MYGPYRGSENAQAEAAVNREIDKIKRDIAAKRKERVSLTQLTTAWKPFSVCLGMMFLLQFSALNVIVYYSVSIFQLSAISIDPNVASIIVGLTLLVSCVVALMVVSRLGRKIMLVLSMTAMAVCHIVLGICFHVQENEMGVGGIMGGQQNSLLMENTTEVQSYKEVLSYTSTMAPQTELVDDHRAGVLGWLPVLTVVVFLFMGNIGYGTLIWVVTGRLLLKAHNSHIYLGNHQS